MVEKMTLGIANETVSVPIILVVEIANDLACRINAERGLRPLRIRRINCR